MTKIARFACVAIAWALCIVWIVSLFFSDKLFDDPDGKVSIVWATLASLALFVTGLVLVIVSLVNRTIVSRLFAVAVLVTPLFHCAGLFIEGPGCYPFFVLPSTAILIAGLRNLVAPLPLQELGV